MGKFTLSMIAHDLASLLLRGKIGLIIEKLDKMTKPQAMAVVALLGNDLKDETEHWDKLLERLTSRVDS